MLLNVMREGGWPMFPTMALGLAALVLSLRHALVPQRSLVPLVLGLGGAALMMGLFGTVVGVQTSAEGIRDAPPEMRWIFLIGLKESLHNLGVGALAATVAAGLCGVGSWR